MATGGAGRAPPEPARGPMDTRPLELAESLHSLQLDGCTGDVGRGTLLRFLAKLGLRWTEGDLEATLTAAGIAQDGPIETDKLVDWLFPPLPHAVHPPLGAAAASGPCTLRIFHVNDVYELAKLANFKTCIRQLASTNSVVLLAGDFLAPSLLSSLDHGRGMVEVLNDVGVEYVCFGNHESDVPHASMLQRMRESKFKWIGTNLPRLKLEDDVPPVLSHAVVSAVGGGQTRKVGLIGLTTDDPGLYVKGSWGGLGTSCMDPLVPTAQVFRERLLREEGCDVVVPMTHQVMTLDRELAERRMGFPLILGGHDHELYHEEVAGAQILKVGMEADTIGVIDLTWPDAATPGEGPTVTVQTLKAEEFEPDRTTVGLIARHESVLKELDAALLCLLPEAVRFTSKKVRLGQVSMGTFIATTLRKALRADCAMLNGGNIRGNLDYPLGMRTFTYAQLKVEVPFDCIASVYRLSGQVINDTVAFSRRFGLQDPPVEKGMYMQVDSDMVWDAAANRVTHIAGMPLEAERVYECATLWGLAIGGVETVSPLLDYCKAHAGELPQEDLARPLKAVFVDYFAVGLLLGLICELRFTGIDQDNDGTISHEELAAALNASAKAPGAEGDLVLSNLFGIADRNGDGYISKQEIADLAIISASDFNLEEERRLGRLGTWTRQDVACRLNRVLTPDHDMLDGLMDKIDTNKDELVTIGEIKPVAAAEAVHHHINI